MQVYNNVSQTSFGQFNMVQVSKKAFSNPTKTKECGELFSRTLAKASKDIVGSKLSNLLKILGLARFFQKTSVFLEFPSVVFKKTADKYAYSNNWLMQNMGCRIEEPISEDYHTFFVLTKEHKNKYLKFMSVGNIKRMMTQYMSEAKEKYTTDPTMIPIYGSMKLATGLDYGFAKTVEGAEMKSFRIDNLDELKGIVPELGI